MPLDLYAPGGACNPIADYSADDWTLDHDDMTPDQRGRFAVLLKAVVTMDAAAFCLTWTDDDRIDLAWQRRLSTFDLTRVFDSNAAQDGNGARFDLGRIATRIINTQRRAKRRGWDS